MVSLKFWKRKGKLFLKARIIDEAKNIRVKDVHTTEIKDIGKFSLFRDNDKDYFIFKTHMVKENGVAVSEYNYNDPIPIDLSPTKTETSGSEVKEAMDSKVVFDLLRFTLSKVESLFVVLAIVNLALTGINVYLTYTTGQSVNGGNELLRSLIKALFPNAFP